MKKTVTALAIVLASTAAIGCYVQVEESSASLSQTAICGATSTCIGGGVPLTLVDQFIPPISVPLGNTLLTRSQSKQGPVTFDGTLTLQQAVFSMDQASVAAHADFSKIQTIDVWAALKNDTCAAPANNPNCVTIASYNGSPAAGTSLVLSGDPNVNLLNVMSSGNQIWVVVRGTGTAPAPPTWNADLDLVIGISARASYP
jgi:hypothetical protein